MGIASDVIYIVLAAMAGGVIAHLLRQPLIIGYILAGVIVGPNTPGPSIHSIHDIEMLAEIGIALLLFTLGLEFSFGELKRFAKASLIGAPIQIVLCSVFVFFIALTFGIVRPEAIWIGGAFSLSSTMVVLKTLAARDALNLPTSRLMLTILIAQDIAVVPLMLILPQLSGTFDLMLILIAIGKSLFFLICMYVLGTKLLPYVFTFIARRGNRELLFLLTLGIAFGAGFLSHALGLSFALGAFISGMLLSETDFNHQALSDVSGLRDLFGIIFFVSVGMLIQFDFFTNYLPQILGLTVIVILGKALIIATSLRLLKYSIKSSVTVGLGLSQIGEFSFVIANVGKQNGDISVEVHALIIAVAVLSMIVTPLLNKFAYAIEPYISNDPVIEPKYESISSDQFESHVIILGGGSVGQFVAKSLNCLQHAPVVIDSDYKVVTSMRDQGLSVVFGDCSHRLVLQAAGIQKARLMIVTINNEIILTNILKEARELNPTIPIVVRWSDSEDSSSLDRFSVQEVVRPLREVSLEMVHQALFALDVPQGEIFSIIGQLRSSSSASLDSNSNFNLLDAARLLEFHWLPELKTQKIIGQTLKESRFRERFGLSVVALLRSDDFVPTPGGEILLQEGDRLGVLGSRKQIKNLLLD
jgi:monovalent cation:H+ antiporter-2, CPA2 family